MYTLCVCLHPGKRAWIGRATGISELVQSAMCTFRKWAVPREDTYI